MNQEEFKALLGQAEAGDVDAMVDVRIEHILGNKQESFKWFKRAADEGDTNAMHLLALYYLLGFGVEKSPKEASFWFETSVDLGNTRALMRWSECIAEDKNKWQPMLVKQLPVFKLFNEALNATKSEDRLRWECQNAFEELLCLIDDVEREHFYSATEEGKGLTHYTSAHVALNVLLPKDNEKPIDVKNIAGLPVKESENVARKLRIGMAVYLNDPTEGRYAFEAVQKDSTLDIQEIQKRFERFYADDDPIATSHLREQIFSLSFSKNRDNLNLWRAYGTTNGLANGVGLFIPNATFQRFTLDGMKGMVPRQNINIDGEEIFEKETEDFLLFEVKYGEDEVKKMWKEINPALKKLFDSIAALNTTTPIRASMDRCIVLALSRLIYLYKHEAYEAEQEVRAIALRSLSDAKLDERTPRRLYCETPELLFLDKGSSIILGPQIADKTELLWETRKRLALLGLDDKVSVTVSTVPFR